MNDLSRRDQAELSNLLAGRIQFERQDLADSQFGDPGTLTAVIELTPSALLVLGTWLQKRTARRSMSLSAEHVAADGSSTKFELQFESAESSPAPPDTIARFAKALSMDPSQLAG